MRTVEFISTLDDPRVAPYRNLKDRELARDGDRFLAEGEQVVRRLLASTYPVESVFLSQKRAEEIAPIVPGSIPVYVLDNELMHQVLGYKFHSGVMACGKRRESHSLETVAGKIGKHATFVILPETCNTENLGSMLRIAAGFGADAVLLGPQCCDPFYRQSIRVSMGTVFSLNVIRSSDLLADLSRLRERYGFQLIAAVVEESAETLRSFQRPDRVGLLFGNEAQGLSPQVVAACDHRVTIPMKLGTDSLNVAVAAGVFLHHFAGDAE